MTSFFLRGRVSVGIVEKKKCPQALIFIDIKNILGIHPCVENFHLLYDNFIIVNN